MFGEKTMQSSQITGTAAYTLDAAVGAFKTWRSQKATGSLVFYCAENGDGTIWEVGYGTLTHGSPDTISRTLVASSTGSLITWVAGDAPIYVMSVPLAVALNHLVTGGLATTRPAWLQAGAAWLDYTLGLAVTWVKKRATSSVAGGDVEEGRFDVAKAIYTPSPRRPWTATGTSGKTIAAADVGGIFTFENSAAARTMTLPALSAVDHGFMVGGLGLTGVGGYGIVLTPNGSDTIESGTAGATRVIPGGVRFDVMKDGATSTWRVIYLNTMPLTAMGRRQTVVGGPVDSSTGLPSFLPSTNGALSITTQNVAIGTPIVASAANGFGLSGPNDSVGFASANFSWTGLTASRAAATPNFLYGTIANGVITPASTIVAPIYQWAGTPGTAAGQFTFNIAEMKGYLGNGTTAPQTNLVMLGEAATDGSTVISTVAYAYNGRYEGAFTATLWSGSTGVSASHNLGVLPRIKDFLLECTTNDNGFLVGEQISMADQTLTSAGIGVYHPHPLAVTRNGMHAFAASTTAFVASDATTGTNVALTPARWKYKPVADRGW